jgi:hypothetical protein
MMSSELGAEAIENNENEHEGEWPDCVKVAEWWPARGVGVLEDGCSK